LGGRVGLHKSGKRLLPQSKGAYTGRDSTRGFGLERGLGSGTSFRGFADLAYYAFRGRRVFCRKKAVLEEIVRRGSGFVRG